MANTISTQSFFENRLEQFCAAVDKEIEKLPSEDIQQAGLPAIMNDVRSIPVEVFSSRESGLDFFNTWNVRISNALGDWGLPTQVKTHIEKLEAIFLDFSRAYFQQGLGVRNTLKASHARTGVAGEMIRDVNMRMSSLALSIVQLSRECAYPRFPQSLACSTGLAPPDLTLKSDPNLPNLMKGRMVAFFQKCITFFDELQNSCGQKPELSALEAKLMERMNRHIKYICEDLQTAWSARLCSLSQSAVKIEPPQREVLSKPEKYTLPEDEEIKKLFKIRINEFICKWEGLSQSLQETCNQDSDLEVQLLEQEMMDSMNLSKVVLVRDLQEMLSEL